MLLTQNKHVHLDLRRVSGPLDLDRDGGSHRAQDLDRDGGTYRVYDLDRDRTSRRTNPEYPYFHGGRFTPVVQCVDGALRQ